MCGTQYVKKLENSTIPEDRWYNHQKQIAESLKRSKERPHNSSALKIFTRMAKDRKTNSKVQRMAQSLNKQIDATQLSVYNTTSQGFKRNAARLTDGNQHTGTLTSGTSKPGYGRG